MKRKSLIVVLMLIVSASSGRADAISDYAVGRKDGNLKATLCTHFRPSTPLVSEESIFEALLSIYGDNEGFITDVLTNEKVLPYYDCYDNNNNVCTTRVIDSSWMVSPEKYMLEASHDLYNLLIVYFTVCSAKGELPFGEVDEVNYRSGEMLRGYAMMDSEPIECIEPAPDYKGDLARMIFYVVTLYPMELWGGWGSVVCRNNSYPTLSPYFADIYMKWHREDPVDEIERARCATIADIQGNMNPFVDYPELAEYLWGDKKGEAYGTGGESGGDNQDDDDDPNVKIPLRGEYSIDDRYLDLYSPYVPDNVKWYIDGKGSMGRVMLSSLGVGWHEITYENDSMKGILKIRIKP